MRLKVTSLQLIIKSLDPYTACKQCDNFGVRGLAEGKTSEMR